VKKILILLIIISNIAFSYINIYPTKFEKDISNGAEENFKLYNRSKDTVKYRIYLDDFTNKENDMSKWIELYPSSISLTPLEEKEIRLVVNKPLGAKPGKYGARLIIKEVRVASKKKQDKVQFMTILKFNMIGEIKEVKDEKK
jgi:P pilus assembly chaperone PapD